MTEQKKTLLKQRSKSNVWMVLLGVGMATLYKYSTEIMSFISGQPPEQIADIGIEGLQPGFLAMFMLPWAGLFSACMCWLIVPQLKEDAFGSNSRWGILFCLFFLSFVLVVA